ncbi:MAG TPA: HEAT repeat domain-containing protein [Bryobacteraceae bacterium]|nr:HEAT repeat domain-containing protein [Bryobacteraceae bacterium]
MSQPQSSDIGPLVTQYFGQDPEVEPLWAAVLAAIRKYPPKDVYYRSFGKVPSEVRHAAVAATATSSSEATTHFLSAVFDFYVQNGNYNPYEVCAKHELLSVLRGRTLPEGFGLALLAYRRYLHDADYRDETYGQHTSIPQWAQTAPWALVDLLLSQLAPSESKHILKYLSANHDAFDTRQALFALAHCGAPEGEHYLMELLRREVVRVDGAFGELQGKHALDPGALEAARTEKAADILDTLVDLIRAVGYARSAQAVPLLIECLKYTAIPGNTGGWCFPAVARALARIATPEAVALLLKFLKGDSDSSFLLGKMKMVAKVLGETHNGGVYEPLVAMLGNRDSDLRTAAAHSLGILGDGRAAVPLRELLADPDTEVKLAAKEALGRLDHAVAPPSSGVAATMDVPSPALQRLPLERQAALWVDCDALRDVGRGKSREMNINGTTWTITPEIASWALPVVELIEEASKTAAMGNFARAIQEFEAVLVLEPACAIAKMSIGCLYDALGTPALGLPMLRQAEQDDPHNPRIIENLRGLEALLPSEVVAAGGPSLPAVCFRVADSSASGGIRRVSFSLEGSPKALPDRLTSDPRDVAGTLEVQFAFPTHGGTLGNWEMSVGYVVNAADSRNPRISYQGLVARVPGYADTWIGFALTVSKAPPAFGGIYTVVEGPFLGREDYVTLAKCVERGAQRRQESAAQPGIPKPADMTGPLTAAAASRCRPSPRWWQFWK